MQSNKNLKYLKSAVASMKITLKSRKAREVYEKIRDAVVNASSTLEKLSPKLTNSTLPVRIELDAGSPDLAKGAELLNTENYIFQWEATEGVATSNGLHKRLSKMIFLNEHRSFELSRNDFRKWHFEPINIDDMTVKGNKWQVSQKSYAQF